MRRLLAVPFLVLAFSVLGVLPARAQAAVAGRWEGAITILGTSLDIAVVFSGDGPALKAAIDIPQQNAKGLPLTAVRVELPKVHFELPAGPGLAVFDGDLSSDRIAGTFTQAGMKGTFEMKRAAIIAVAAQEPLPYKEVEVKIQGGPVTLAGTLTLPPSTGAFPAVVLITGSGAQNRDEELFGFKPFRVIADHLTRKGIAVLRCDDRGVGGSSGSTQEATSADFAEDVVAQVRFLQARPDIDKKAIGVLGHSEGGLVGPLAASRSSDIAFVIMMSGPALTGERIMLAQGELLGRAAGRTDEQIKRNADLQRQLFATVRSGTGWEQAEAAVRAEIERAMKEVPEQQRAAIGDVDKAIQAQVAGQMKMVRTPWFKFFLDYDPLPTLEKLKCPILAVFGELDLQVPAEANRAALEQALVRSGHRDHVVRVMPGANHLYQAAKTGSVAEYAVLKKEFVPGLLDLYTNWILEHAKTGR